MYAEIISDEMQNQANLILWFSLNLKKYKIDSVKKRSPGILLSGQIAIDLNVGERKIVNDNNIKSFLSTSENLIDKHL